MFHDDVLARAQRNTDPEQLELTYNRDQFLRLAQLDASVGHFVLGRLRRNPVDFESSLEALFNSEVLMSGNRLMEIAYLEAGRRL